MSQRLRTNSIASWSTDREQQWLPTVHARAATAVPIITVVRHLRLRGPKSGDSNTIISFETRVQRPRTTIRNLRQGLRTGGSSAAVLAQTAAAQACVATTSTPRVETAAPSYPG